MEQMPLPSYPPYCMRAYIHLIFKHVTEMWVIIKTVRVLSLIMMCPKTCCTASEIASSHPINLPLSIARVVGPFLLYETELRELRW